MILLKDYLKKEVYLTYLAPIHSKEAEIVGIVKQIK